MLLPVAHDGQLRIRVDEVVDEHRVDHVRLHAVERLLQARFTAQLAADVRLRRQEQSIANVELLRKIADRLRDAVRPGDTVSRYGGDEFVVIVEGLSDTEQAVEVAERIRAVLRDPIDVDGESVTIGASIGIAVTWGFDGDGVPATPEGLLRAADAAMYEAKRKGRGEVVIAAP